MIQKGKQAEERNAPDFVGAIRKIIAKETSKIQSRQIADASITDEGVNGLTRTKLEKHWDEEVALNGVERIIGIPLLRINWRSATLDQRKLMTFLPLYLVPRLLKCHQCGQCCRPNHRSWDKGVVLSRDEVSRLKHMCKLEKHNGSILMKYPCPLLDVKICSHYLLRPAGCRFFPFNRWQDDATKEEGLGIVMHCPAAKEFYVTVNLFMQLLHQFMTARAQTGEEGFAFEDLDRLSMGFEPSAVSPEDRRYIVEKVESVT
ncbi:MAG: YkgJ family cysteine cluster protein [Dehalogenimonas sp.]